MTITIDPMTVTIGAEIGGVDLADDLSDDTIEEIRQALLDWKVIFFRDQHGLDRASHVAFGRRFGDLEIHPVTPKDQDQPEVFVIPAGGEFRAPDNWHSDVTWRPAQLLHTTLLTDLAMFNALQPGVFALSGWDLTGMLTVDRELIGHLLATGDTRWIHRGAYDLLDDETKELIDDKKATHDYASAFGRNQPPEVQDKMRAQHPTVEHPIVRTHPETGRKTLYVNVGFTRSIVGMDPEEGKALLHRLYRQSSIVDTQCRFRWRPGSVAFWDNRATQHIVSNDFLPRGRVMERVTVVGDKPY